MADAHALKKIGIVLVVTFAVTSMAGMVVSGHLGQAQVESDPEAPSADSTPSAESTR